MRSILIWAPIDTSGSYKGAACKGAHILHCSALKAFNAQYCVGAEVLAGRPRRVGGAPAGDIHGREADPPHTTREWTLCQVIHSEGSKRPVDMNLEESDWANSENRCLDFKLKHE